MEKPSTPDYTKIRTEIMDRIARDQEMRARDMAGEEVWDDSVEIDDTIAMKHIIAVIGWPTISKVGKEASEAAWLLVQHADLDPVFQQQCLDLMRALPETEVARIDFAKLEDRVRVNTGRKQLYGTQFAEAVDDSGMATSYEPRPIEDIEHLDERRAALGLEPFTEYKKHLTQKYFPHLLHEKLIRFVRPEMAGEKDEIVRVIKEFFADVQPTPSLEQLIELFDNAPIVELSDADWERLENTDSFYGVQEGDIEGARNITEGYNEDLPEEYHRDFDALLAAFKKGNDIECPMIIAHNNRTHLVSGNTRLMIMRVLGMRPHVIIATMNNA